MTGHAGQVLQQATVIEIEPSRTPSGRSGRADSRRTRLAALVPAPGETPFTFGYLAILLGTTLVLRLADPVLTARLLALSSTDAHNLWHRPLLSLVTSAAWLSGADWLPYVLIFALTVAPLERRIGSLRTAGVFFGGHVLATLATEVPIMWAISTRLLPKADGRWLDIGVSYGFFTTAGALVFLLGGHRRLWALLAMDTVIALIYLTDDPATMESVVTLLGHAIAAQFGLLCCGPLLRRHRRGSAWRSGKQSRKRPARDEMTALRSREIHPGGANATTESAIMQPRATLISRLPNSFETVTLPPG
jgi:hypothetical protein